MNGPGINPNPIANPDLVCLADVKFRMLIHKTSLSLELTVKPKIVRIQERYIMAASIGSRLNYAPRIRPFFLLQKIAAVMPASLIRWL